MDPPTDGTMTTSRSPIDPRSSALIPDDDDRTPEDMQPSPLEFRSGNAAREAHNPPSGRLFFSSEDTTRWRKKKGGEDPITGAVALAVETRKGETARVMKASTQSHPITICFANSSCDNISAAGKLIEQGGEDSGSSGPQQPQLPLVTHRFGATDAALGTGTGTGMDLEPTPLHEMETDDEDELDCSNNSKSTRTTSSSTISTSSSVKKRVRWHSIHTREFSLVVGDHPLCQDGLPVSLGWHYSDAPAVPCSSILQSPFCIGASAGGLAGPRCPSLPGKQHQSSPRTSLPDADEGIRSADHQQQDQQFKMSSAPLPYKQATKAKDSEHADNFSSPVNVPVPVPSIAARSFRLSERVKSYVFPRRMSYEERCRRLCHVSGWTMEEVQREEVDLVVRTLKESWEHLDDEHIVAPISPTANLNGNDNDNNSMVAADADDDDQVTGDALLDDMMVLDEIPGLDDDFADIPDMDWFDSL